MHVDDVENMHSGQHEWDRMNLAAEPHTHSPSRLSGKNRIEWNVGHETTRSRLVAQ